MNNADGLEACWGCGTRAGMLHNWYPQKANGPSQKLRASWRDVHPNLPCWGRRDDTACKQKSHPGSLQRSAPPSSWKASGEGGENIAESVHEKLQHDVLFVVVVSHVLQISVPIFSSKMGDGSRGLAKLRLPHRDQEVAMHPVVAATSTSDRLLQESTMPCRRSKAPMEQGLGICRGWQDTAISQCVGFLWDCSRLFPQEYLHLGDVLQDLHVVDVSAAFSAASSGRCERTLYSCNPQMSMTLCHNWTCSWWGSWKVPLGELDIGDRFGANAACVEKTLAEQYQFFAWLHGGCPTCDVRHIPDECNGSQLVSFSCPFLPWPWCHSHHLARNTSTSFDVVCGLEKPSKLLSFQPRDWVWDHASHKVPTKLLQLVSSFVPKRKGQHRRGIYRCHPSKSVLENQRWEHHLASSALRQWCLHGEEYSRQTPEPSIDPVAWSKCQTTNTKISHRQNSRPA